MQWYYWGRLGIWVLSIHFYFNCWVKLQEKWGTFKRVPWRCDVRLQMPSDSRRLHNWASGYRVTTLTSTVLPPFRNDCGPWASRSGQATFSLFLFLLWSVIKLKKFHSHVCVYFRGYISFRKFFSTVFNSKLLQMVSELRLQGTESSTFMITFSEIPLYDCSGKYWLSLSRDSKLTDLKGVKRLYGFCILGELFDRLKIFKIIL